MRKILENQNASFNHTEFFLEMRLAKETDHERLGNQSVWRKPLSLLVVELLMK